LKTLSHDGWIRSFAVSVDGSLLATCSTYPVWGKAHLWNLKTGERLHTWSIDRLKTGMSIRGVTLGGDGSSVIAAMSDGSLRRWDVSTGEECPIARAKRKQEGEPAPPKRADGNDLERPVFSRDGRSVALIGRGPSHVVDLASGDLRFKAPAPMSRSSEFAPDGRSLAFARQGRGKEIRLADGMIRGDSTTAPSTIVWLDASTGHVRREIEIPESRVECLAFSPDGRAIAAGTSFHWERGIIRIYRLRDKQEVQAIETPCPWMQGLAFTPDGKRIIAGLSDTSIVIWDVRPLD
jgi:WD40 repeat protein